MLLFFASAVSAWAGTVSLTVDGAADHALRCNPTLAAARLRIEEARARLQQRGRLSNPELDLEFTRHTIGREGSASVALLQRLPLTARLRHEKAITRAELAAAEAEVRDAERKLAAEARAAAVKLIALRGQRALRTEQLANSRELFGFLLKRVESGEASLVDASQVELESRQIEIEDLQLDAEEVTLRGEIRPLLGMTGEVAVHITGTLPAPLREPAGADPAERPDLRAAESRAEAARAVVLEQTARRWEDIGIGASYSRERVLDEPRSIETEQIVGLRFSLPLPLWNNNAGRIREAQAEATRAELQVAAVALNAHAEVAAARAAMSAYARLIDELDGKALPKATEIEDLLRRSYATGQTPLTEVLRTRTRRLELQRQRLDALRDYHLARIRHDSALGHPQPTTP